MNSRDCNFKLNLKVCMLFEQLMNKSFFKCETEEDMIYLMYAAFVVNNGMQISFKAFLNLLEDKKLVQNFTNEFERLSKFMEQFKGDDTKEKEVKSESSEDMTMRITDAVMTLIINNKLDPHYVMYEMELWELTPFMEAMDTNYKSEMEEKRLWSFINVMPHIDHKKCKSPEQLLPFPWTKEEKKKKNENSLKNNMYAIRHTIGMTFIPGKKNGEE